MLKIYTHLMTTLAEMRENEDGVTAIEYGLIAALIAVTIIASVSLVGDELTNTFTDISDELTGVVG
jgi:pilus assembly protein Flp/PilA